VLRVLVVAEPRLYREGLAQVVGDGCHVDVVGAVGDAAAARAQGVALAPDIVLFDMSVAGGASTLLSIVQATPSAKVVALGIAGGDDTVIACFEAGAAGYVPPDGSLLELQECISMAARNEVSCSPRIAAQLARRLASLANATRSERPMPQLTAREAEILQLIDEGLSNKAIAHRLCIEVPTVKNHVHNILEKLEVTRRGEAAARLRRDLLAVTPAMR
jgi:DNA-binding NarL/FixJ family response regulator